MYPLFSSCKRGSWKQWALLVVSAIVVIISIRVYFLDVNLPHNHYVCDSVDIVINAICINAYGTDEWAVPYPLVGFRSFGEYKSPLYIYLLALVFKIAPPGVFSARIFSMLLGLAGIALLVLHARKLMDLKPYYTYCASFFGLMVLSSWILVPHRMPVEVTLAVLIITAMFIITYHFFIAPNSLIYGVLLGGVTGLMPYLYSASKPFYAVQLPLVAFCLFTDKGIKGLSWKNARALYLAIGVALLMGLPVFIDLCTSKHFLARYNAVREGNILHILTNYFLNANPVFWFLKGDANFRHHTGFLGMLNPVFAFFLTLGIGAALKRIFTSQQRPYYLYILLYLLMSFVPVAMSRADDLPHAMRTLICVTPLLLLCFVGGDALYKWCVTKKTIRTFYVLSLLSIFLGAGFAAKNVSHYLKAAKEPAEMANTYDMPKPDAYWRQDERIVPYWDRSFDTRSYRYYRMTEKQEYCFCLPPPGYKPFD